MIATKWVWDRVAPALPWIVLSAVLIGSYWWQARYHYGRGEDAGAARVQAAWDDADRARAAALAAYRKTLDDEAKAQAAEARRQEESLREQVQIADARGRDLARRLREHEQRERARRLSAAVLPGSAACADAAGGIPGDGGAPRTAVDAALEEHLAACARDAERLDGWRRWHASVTAK